MWMLRLPKDEAFLEVFVCPWCVQSRSSEGSNHLLGYGKGYINQHRTGLNGSERPEAFERVSPGWSLRFLPQYATAS